MKENYYALLIAILTGRTATQSLACMGFSVEED